MTEDQISLPFISLSLFPLYLPVCLSQHLLFLYPFLNLSFFRFPFFPDAILYLTLHTHMLRGRLLYSKNSSLYSNPML